jgi:isopenicillin-N N-acyltransferase-like protein
MTGSVRVVEVAGSPFELGRQHGQACAEPIVRFVRVGLPAYVRCAPTDLLSTFANELGVYAGAIARVAPHLLEEVRGIAAGAGLAFEEALLLQLRPELGQARRRWVPECTSIGVVSGRATPGGPLLGQNVDMPRELAEYGIVLRLRPTEGPEILTWTLAGVIGQTGINEWGVGRCGNVLFSPGWRPGLPTVVLFRLALESKSVAQVLEWCGDSGRAKSNNFLIGDAEGDVACVEMTVDDHRVLRAGTDGVIVHGNHYRHPDFAAFDRCPYPDGSRRRETRLAELAGATSMPLEALDLQRFLSDHANQPQSICGHGPPGLQTVASCVLDPAHGRLWVSHGNPCQMAYTLYTLRGPAA